MADDGRPFCVHGPMLKRGKRRDGQQNWGCSDAIRRELKGYYERNALSFLMKKQLRAHAQRLAELRHQIEGD